MVKKNYVAPASNEARTRLRATLLAGSIGGNPSGTGANGKIVSGQGDPTTQTGSEGPEFAPARQRSVSSVD